MKISCTKIEMNGRICDQVLIVANDEIERVYRALTEPMIGDKFHGYPILGVGKFAKDGIVAVDFEETNKNKLYQEVGRIGRILEENGIFVME